MLALTPINTTASDKLSNGLCCLFNNDKLTLSIVSRILKKKTSCWSLRSFSKNKVSNHPNVSSISLPTTIKYILPPSYDDKSHPWAFQFPNSMNDRVVLPREEEGCEKLPDYLCTLEKIAPAYVKCELTKPEVRSTNRPWRYECDTKKYLYTKYLLQISLFKNIRNTDTSI